MKLFYTWIILILIFRLGITENSPKNIFKKYRDSVCLVSYFQNIASESRIGSINKVKKNRNGILVDNQGLVLVSSDVFPVSVDIISENGSFLSRQPTEFMVKFSKGPELPAEFIGKDDQAQIAFIRIIDFKQDSITKPILFHTNNNLGVADTLFILELLPKNYNFEHLFTTHTINAVVESPVKRYLINNYVTALSAGGLVLDAGGNAIGVTLKQSLNFSIGVSADFEDLQKNFLEIAPAFWFVHLIQDPPKLYENEDKRRSWLGISMQALNNELQTYWNVPQAGGVIVNRIFEESPAEYGGLQVGDIILKLNDSTLLVQDDEDTAKLRNLIREHPPGKPVKLKIFRKGKIITKTIVPTAAPKAIGLADSYPVSSLGFELRELTLDIIYQENFPLKTPGAFVFQVDRASAAGLGGLMIGDIVQEINDITVLSLEDARKIIADIIKSSPKMIKLKVLNNKATRFVFIENKKDESP